MTQIWFYHLESRPLESVLPVLVQKCLGQSWNAVVETTGEDRLTALDDLLWTFSDDSFIPHGTRRDGNAERQPVWLTTSPENPNAAKVRFCVDGADPSASLASEPPYSRIFVLFDGRDEDALVTARQQWSALKGSPHERVYWKMNEDGVWQKKA